MENYVRGKHGYLNNDPNATIKCEAWSSTYSVKWKMLGDPMTHVYKDPIASPLINPFNHRQIIP
jgi:hypothetical protein